MLCTTCLGVLEECRNPIVVDHYWCHFPETTAGKSIFRQGTIDITTPQSGHERTALFENTTSSTAPDSFATSSDEGELAQRFCSDSQPVSASESDSSDDAYFSRHAIYGHHATLADLKTAASSGCQLCWQVWDLLDSDKSKIDVDVSKAGESNKSHFSTCLNVNSSTYLDEPRFAIYYDGVYCPQRVCDFKLFPTTRMRGLS